MQSNKRPRISLQKKSILEQITLIPDTKTGLVDNGEFLKTFARFQVAYIPQVNKVSSANFPVEGKIDVKDFFSIFQNLEKKDQETWTEETWNAKETDDECKTRIPGHFLRNDAKDQRGYCSFIVQNDEKQLEHVLENLPISDLPVAAAVKEKDDGDAQVPENVNDSKHLQPQLQDSNIFLMEYGPGLWIFFGRNDHGLQPLEGRGEHTDSIEHDGTWHYQLSGVKDWYLRPTKELVEKMDDEEETDEIRNWKEEMEDDEKENISRLQLSCSSGDILLVNTRLWWHSTKLPGQPRESDDSSSSVPSVSYARDIYLSKNSNGEGRQGSSMTNLDGLYAADDIEAGTIIFRESEMPDCELHRTKENPNCEIIELGSGEGAIASCRDIKAGEFFCIIESDDESEEFDTDDEVEVEECMII